MNISDVASPEHSVRVERVFDASPEALYAAWTEPDIMQRWFGRVEADVRVGGNYRVESDGDEGEVYVHCGRYLALEPGRLVKQTFGVEGHGPSPYQDEFIAVSFHPLDGRRTKLVLDNGWNGPGADEAGVEATQQGWSMWLDLLEAMFERNPELRRRP